MGEHPGMEIDLAVVADYAAVTQEGKLVIAGVFDRVLATRLPWSHPSMSLVFRLRVHPGEGRAHEVRVTCVDPDGVEVLPPLLQRMEAPEGGPTEEASANFVLGIGGVNLGKPGRHHFEIFVDGRHERTVPFDVVLQRKQEAS